MFSIWKPGVQLLKWVWGCSLHLFWVIEDTKTFYVSCSSKSPGDVKIKKISVGTWSRVAELSFTGQLEGDTKTLKITRHPSVYSESNSLWIDTVLWLLFLQNGCPTMFTPKSTNEEKQNPWATVWRYNWNWQTSLWWTEHHDLPQDLDHLLSLIERER